MHLLETVCSGPNEVDPCDGGIQFVRAASGEITSPNHPGQYPNQKTCRYAIDVSGKLYSYVPRYHYCWVISIIE